MRRAAAGVMFTDKYLRTLLVKPTYKPYWDLPGGIVEPNESPRGAAEREVKEELGIVIEATKLLVVDFFPPTTQCTEAMMYVFHSELPIGSQITLQTAELAACEWVFPHELAELVKHAPILLQRIYSARAAHIMRTTYYCESGQIRV